MAKGACIFVRLKWIDVSYALVNSEGVLIKTQKEHSCFWCIKGENPFEKNFISIQSIRWHAYTYELDKASVFKLILHWEMRCFYRTRSSFTISKIHQQAHIIQPKSTELGVNLSLFITKRLNIIYVIHLLQSSTQKFCHNHQHKFHIELLNFNF